MLIRLVRDNYLCLNKCLFLFGYKNSDFSAHSQQYGVLIGKNNIEQ